MIKISDLVPWRRGDSVSAAVGLAGLAFALAVGCVSMSVLFPSGEALAANECDQGGARIQKKYAADSLSSAAVAECGFLRYRLGSETDDSGFPLTAQEDGSAPNSLPEGNIVYSMSDWIVLQKYDHDENDDTAEVLRPWWKAACTADSGQMCWTTVTGTVTAPPSDATIFYRLVDKDDNSVVTSLYLAGPPASVEGVTTRIGIPSGPTAQVATKGADGSTDADHNKYFVNAASDANPSYALVHVGWAGGVVVRGIKERIVRLNNIPERIPRTLVEGEDEDGFGRYAVKFDASTGIGVRVRAISLVLSGRGNSQFNNIVVEGGADKVSIIENRQIKEGGSRDGGGLYFVGDGGTNMNMELGGKSSSGTYMTRATVIARSAGEDSEFHAIRYHQDVQRGENLIADLKLVSATVQMYNGGTAPEEGRGMIVTTGDDSSGITISVANPVGEEDDDGDSTGGIKVYVNTPVTVKTSGARSHGIVLNLGGEQQEELSQRAAILMEASHRNTKMRVGMSEGTASPASNNLLYANYKGSVRIATDGHKSGGIVIRNSSAAGEGGEYVMLGGIAHDVERRVERASDFADPDDNSKIRSDLADYSLVLDKPIVTTGAGSHGIVTSIAESGITMVVDIEDLDDGDASNGVEQTIRASGTGSQAFSGAGSMGKFTVNVQGHVTGGIVTGDGADTITVGDPGADADDDEDDKVPTISGGIDAGGGDDTVNVRFGSVTGTVASGAGCDMVTLSAGVSVGGMSLGQCEGEGKKNVLNTAIDLGDVAAGGNSELNLAGRTVGSVTLTGSGTTTVDGGTVGRLRFSAAAGTAAKVVVGTSTNTVTITGNIEGGAGNDEVELSSGTIFSVDDTSTADENEASMISLGAGDDTLTYTAVRLSGGTATTNARRNLPIVDAGAGCDSITLSASGSTGSGTDSTAGGIDLGACEGDGMDQLTSNIVIEGNIESSGNSRVRLTGGSVNGNLALGAGDDDVVLGNGASISGTISLGAGNNMLTSSQISVLTSIASDSAGASGDTPAESTTVQLNSGGVSNGMTFGSGNDVARWVGAVTVSGAVVLGGGDDIVDGGRMIGSIAGGDGDDTVTLIGGTVSMMTGVETFNKMGISTLTVGSMSNPAASASTLSGSTADAGDPVTVNVNQGKLVVSGHLNLGSTGTLTVKKDAFLSFDISGMASQYEDGGTVSHGRITAGEVVLVEALPEIELVSGSAAPAAADIAAATVSRLINGKVVRQAGDDEEIVPAIVRGGANPGVISPGAGGTPSGPTAAADDDDNTAIYAVGALAVLWWVMRKDDMGSGSGLVDYESGTAERSFATISGSRTHSSGAMKTWANYYSDSASPVQGLAVGMETPISSNGSFSFSAMPEAKGSLSLNTLSLNQKSSFQGGHYSVKGKWQSEDYFATAELSYADAVSSTSFDNPTAGGKLSGKFDMTNSHLEIGAGAKVQLTDTLSVAPTIGVYGGSISQSESVLTGRSVVARMSKQEQSYTGWNLGIRVQPDAWTTDGAEFQPNFSLNTFRTSSDSRSLDLRQSDKAGVLDFSSQLPVQGMPAVVNAFRAGMTMKSETGLKLDLDYVGMEIDGELQHGAIARMQTRF